MIPEAILFAEAMLFIVYFILTAYRDKIKQYVFGVDFGKDETCVSVSYSLEDGVPRFEGWYELAQCAEYVWFPGKTVT